MLVQDAPVPNHSVAAAAGQDSRLRVDLFSRRRFLKAALAARAPGHGEQRGQRDPRKQAGLPKVVPACFCPACARVRTDAGINQVLALMMPDHLGLS
jgi:hypothetical protein